MRALRAMTALGLALVVAGCWPFDIDAPDFDFDTFSCTGPERSFDGAWVIRGTGARDRCDDENLNTELFEVRSRALVFRTVEGGFFFDREASAVPDSFDVLMTEARDRCASFVTVESTSRGPVRLTWNAVGTSNPDEVEGEFEGDGPGDCRVRGNFRAVVTPLE